jgi:hypothetical protein
VDKRGSGRARRAGCAGGPGAGAWARRRGLRVAVVGRGRCAGHPLAYVLPERARASDTVEPMEDKEIMAHIDDLIKTEHELRAKLAAGQITTEAEHRQLAEAETALDQYWDLLRQRRARREFGEDPADAQVRPVGEVEGYRQ